MSLSASLGSLTGCPQFHAPRAWDLPKRMASARGPGHPREPDHDTLGAGPPPSPPPLTPFHSSKATGAQVSAPTHRATSLPPPSLTCCAQLRHGAQPASSHQSVGKPNAGFVASCPRAMPPVNPVSSKITHESQQPKSRDFCHCDNRTHQRVPFQLKSKSSESNVKVTHHLERANKLEAWTSHPIRAGFQRNRN